MRLCHCPNCKQEIESDAPICPHCSANVNQHRARDVARFLLFGLAVMFVFTLIAALNDSGRRRSERASGGVARLTGARTLTFAAPPQVPAPPGFQPPTGAQPFAAEGDPSLREWRPRYP